MLFQVSGMLEMAFSKGKSERYFFLGGGGWGMAPDPLRDRAREMGPSLAFHTIADESYVNSVQLPLSGIPGSAPGLPDKLGRFGIDANHSKWFEPRSITSSYCVIVGGGGDSSEKNCCW